MNQVKRPIDRGRLRQYVGKEFFILKRKWRWLIESKKYASKQEKKHYTHEVFKHRSLVLRPLKDVDMYIQENKRTNLAIALQHINEVEIKPGQYFSLWKLVGRPTKRKGYLEGLVLKSGTIATDTGGGLCQMGNLLFWIFAHSPLTVTERYRHGYDVFPDVNRKVPFGAGATLSYNYIDLQVYNPTNNSFKLKLWLDKTHLNCILFSRDLIKATYGIEERNHHIKQQYWGGYTRHNQIVQIKTEDKGRTEKLLVENHAIMMYNPLLNN